MKEEEGEEGRGGWVFGAHISGKGVSTSKNRGAGVGLLGDGQPGCTPACAPALGQDALSFPLEKHPLWSEGEDPLLTSGH